jgi:hypothetical protein
MQSVLVFLVLAAQAASEDGFTAIFDKSTSDGWKQAGPGGFNLQDGVATPHGGMGLWYYEKKQFENFILKLEYRQEKLSSNSGVFVRFPRVEGDPWIPVREGYEIQIAGDKPGKNSTGAVYDFQGATEVPLKPAGEWNEYEIACAGQEYVVRLNGRLINRYTGSRAVKGMIGLQNHDDQSIVQFRNVRVRELPAEAASVAVPFNGKDLAGWEGETSAFNAAGGVLSTAGTAGIIWSDKSFKDFVLLLEWKTATKDDNSGVFLRMPDPAADVAGAIGEGYEIQIRDTGPAAERTGSFFAVKDATEVPTKPAGQWNHLEVRAKGQTYEVLINGKRVNALTGDRAVQGRLGLQSHESGAKVEFRNVRLIELK